MRSFPASAMYLHVFLVTSHLSFFLGFVSLFLAPPLPPQPVQLAIPHWAVMTETRLETRLERRENLRITISSLYCSSWAGGMLYRSDCLHSACSTVAVHPPGTLYVRLAPRSLPFPFFSGEILFFTEIFFLVSRNIFNFLGSDIFRRPHVNNTWHFEL